MSKLKIRNTDNTFSEVATVDYVDSQLGNTGNNTTYTLTKSGSTITLTGSDGSTTSVTDTDTNTTYSTGTASTAGLTKLYTSTGTSTDGTMTRAAIKTELDGKVPTARTVNGKALSSNITLNASDVGADASGAANTALTNAKSYTDTALSTAKSYTDTSISNLINSAPTTLDTLGEIATAMAANAEVVEALETSIGNKADKSAIPTKVSQLTNDSGYKTTDTNTTYTISKSGSTITLTGSDGTTSTVTDSDTNTTYSAATTSANGLMTSAMVTKLNGIATGAEVNQNAFSNVTVGSTTIAADGKADTLTLVAGSNVTLTPDATNDKITIAATDTVYTHPTSAGNKHIPAGGSSGQILRWSADGTAVWGADNNTTYSAATQSANGLMSAADKTKLDGIDTDATKNTASSTTPKAAGTASVGSETAYARGDHVHAAQTTISGNAGSATKLATARNFTIGKTAKSFNGTAAVSWTLDEIGSNVYVGTSAPSDADVDVWIDPTGSVNLSALWNSIYPVGAIYMSVSSTNPGTLFPGTTWTALQDRFLVGAGNSYAVNATGGHKDLQSHTHSIPALSGTAAASKHTHVVTTKTTTYAQGSQSSWRCLSWPGTNADYSQTVTTNNGTADGSHTHSVTTTANTSGSTGAGNGGNLPPYLAVYMWKRTA